MPQKLSFPEEPSTTAVLALPGVHDSHDNGSCPSPRHSATPRGISLAQFPPAVAVSLSLIFVYLLIISCSVVSAPAGYRGSVALEYFWRASATQWMHTSGAVA